MKVSVLSGGGAPGRVQCFRILMEPDPDVLLWVMHPFGLARLVPDRIDVRYDKSSASPALSVTAHYSDVGDGEALELVTRLLKTPKVRAATVETIVAKAT
jgi:hypothetical protein